MELTIENGLEKAISNIKLSTLLEDRKGPCQSFNKNNSIEDKVS